MGSQEEVVCYVHEVYRRSGSYNRKRSEAIDRFPAEHWLISFVVEKSQEAGIDVINERNFKYKGDQRRNYTLPSALPTTYRGGR